MPQKESEIHKVLVLLSKNHNDWKERVRKMGCPEQDVEDVVQEAYLKVSGLMQRGANILTHYEDGNYRVNYWYFHLTLRSVFTDLIRSRTRSKISLWEGDKETMNFVFSQHPGDEESYNYDRDREAFNLFNEINEYMNDWDAPGEYPYNKAICMAYMQTDMSIRELSKGSSISVNTIFNTISAGRQLLRNKFGRKVDKYFKKQRFHAKNEKQE